MSSALHLHIDPYSGVSGDMFLGALVDAGLELEQLQGPLSSMGLAHWCLERSDRSDPRIGGTKVDVVLEEGHDRHHRHLGDITQLIQNAAGLPDSVRRQACAVFALLAEAEGEVHGVPPEEVHFHEVGATDAIIDITGTVLGVHLLGVASISCGPLPMGSGFAECEHGTIPVPVPATALLSRGLPTVPAAGEHPTGELVTPTGAALVRCLADRFGPAPAMTLNLVAYGLGARDRGLIPNALRLLIGSRDKQPDDEVEVIITTIDDLDPRLFGPLVEDLLAAGALDATLRPVFAKKGRPGTEVVVIAPPVAETVRALSELLFRETTTFGVRIHRDRRTILDRRFRTVATELGDVVVKDGLLNGVVVTSQPEFDSCAALADTLGVPVRKVLDAAIQAAGAPHSAPTEDEGIE
jgi:uncharacterized protein (TIGR00299 family) protein